MENKCCCKNENGVHVCVHVDRCNTGSEPVGHILAFMGSTPPDGYLLCDGTEHSLKEYAALSEHFMKQFGSVNYFGGDGTETFAVPDLRGEFLRGAGTATRSTGTGADVGGHQDATKIPLVGGNNNRILWTPDFEDLSEMWTQNSDMDYYSKHGIINQVKHANKDGFGPSIADNARIGFSARPTNTAVLYCIKYAQ